MKKNIVRYLSGMALTMIAATAAVYFVGYTEGVPTGDKPTMMYGAILGAAAVKVLDVTKRFFTAWEGRA